MVYQRSEAARHDTIFNINDNMVPYLRDVFTRTEVVDMRILRYRQRPRWNDGLSTTQIPKTCRSTCLGTRDQSQSTSIPSLSLKSFPPCLSSHSMLPRAIL